MPKQTFKEIRAQYPSEFLVLLEYDEDTLPDGKIDVIAAKEVQYFESGEEMREAYKQLKKPRRRLLSVHPNIKSALSLITCLQ